MTIRGVVFHPGSMSSMCMVLILTSPLNAQCSHTSQAANYNQSALYNPTAAFNLCDGLNFAYGKLFMMVLHSLIKLVLAAASSACLTNAAGPTNSTTTPTCTRPTGLANTLVPAPPSLGPSFQVKPSFAAAHSVFLFDELPASFSEASIATFCFEQCLVYQPNATRGPCLSFNVNLGKPVPPTGNGGPTQYFCSGFDAYIAGDGSDLVAVDIPGSYLYPIAINRVCNGTYRAY